MHTTIIGLDLAKNVFQLHAEDASGAGAVEQKRLRREELEPYLRKQPPALIGMEACGSAHHWAPGDQRAGPRGASDARQIREGIRQAGQERRARCGGDLRGGAANQHAVCADQECRAADRPFPGACPRAAGEAAHPADECRHAVCWPNSVSSPRAGLRRLQDACSTSIDAGDAAIPERLLTGAVKPLLEQWRALARPASTNSRRAWSKRARSDERMCRLHADSRRRAAYRACPGHRDRRPSALQTPRATSPPGSG